MRGIQCDVTRDEGADPATMNPGDRVETGPEKPVMDNHEVTAGCPVDRGLTRVHCGHNAADRSRVFDLETVQRPGVVRDLPSPQELIEVAGYFFNMAGHEYRTIIVTSMCE